MITPTPITADQLRFAQTRQVGDTITPTRQMLEYFRLPRFCEMTIKGITVQPGISQNDLAFKVGQLSGYYDASWFNWTVPVDPRFVDPSVYKVLTQ